MAFRIACSCVLIGRSRLTPEPSITSYDVEPLTRGSKLTLSNEAAFSGWMRPFERLFQRSVQGMFERDVARLKRVVEAEAMATGSAGGTGSSPANASRDGGRR